MAFTTLGLALGHFVLDTPFADIHGRLAPILNGATMDRVRLWQPCFNTGPLPRAGIEILDHRRAAGFLGEHNQVKVRMPAVLAIGNFLRTDEANDLDLALLLAPPESAIARHALESHGQTRQRIVQIVTDAMGNRQGHEVDTKALVHAVFHCLLELDPPPFGNLGRADRTRPNRPASHQAVIERLAVGLPLVHLDLG